MHLSQFYPFTREQVGVKIFELIRAYHTESHKLIVKGLAVKLGKIKSKTITAKHLALNSSVWPLFFTLSSASETECSARVG